MAKNNVQSVFYLRCTQVIKPQIIHKPQNQSWHKEISGYSTQTTTDKYIGEDSLTKHFAT